MQKKIALILTTIILAAAACRKGTFAPEQYYGKITVNSSALSIVDMDVYLDTTKAVRLKPGKSFTSGFRLAGKSTHLTIYKADSAHTSNNLILDTLLGIPKNNLLGLDVIYSELLGIKGVWDKTIISVPPDSIRLQIKYVSTVANANAPAVPSPCNLHVYFATNLKDSVDLGPHTINQFSKAFTFSYMDPNTKKIRVFYYNLYNPATGKRVTGYANQAAYVLYSFNATNSNGGMYALLTVTISDDASHAGAYKMPNAATLQKVN